VTLPRRVIPGSTYLVTRRCSRREFRLTSDAQLVALFAYLLAVYSVRHGVKVHAAVSMLNHYHIVASDPRGKICDFVRDFDALMARATNAEQGRRENMWSSPQRSSQVTLIESEDVWRKLVYTLANPAAAGLVDRLSDWPNFKTRPVDIERAPAVYRRPKLRFFTERCKMPAEATLELTVPEAVGDMTLTAYTRELRERVAVREAELRAERKAEGRHILGVRRLKCVRDNESPSTEAAHGARDPAIAAKQTASRVEALRALRVFRDAYCQALEKWRNHEVPVTFPYGTFKMRSYPGVVIGLPPPALSAA